MLIKPNDRVLLSGKTGSGKTLFAMRMLAPVKRLIVLDPKANLTDWNLKTPNGRDWWRFGRGSNGRFRILPPIVNNAGLWYEQLFERLYDIGDLTLYIDEAYAIGSGQRPGAWLQALYTRGRELGIGIWAATQRPTWIPLFLISEADWLITFRLNLEDDRRRLATVCGDQVIGRIPDPHGFWIYNVQSETPTYYKTSVLTSQKMVQ